MATLLEQLDAMRTLPANWDGYNAEPPVPEVLDVAKEFVALLLTIRGSAPTGDIFVHPGRAGGVQIGWEDARAEHELDIEPDGTWDFLRAPRETERAVVSRYKANQPVAPMLRMLREIFFA